MPEIVRNRTISPLTRKETSPNYRVAINGISAGDTLVVNVSHKNKPYHKTFRFKGSEVLKKKSLGFTVTDDENGIRVHWTSTQPSHG